MMSSSLPSTDLQAKYDLIEKLHEQYTSLPDQVQSAISQELLTGKKNSKEWLSIVQQMIAYKYEVRQAKSNCFLEKPKSAKQLIRNAFWQAVLVISILWAIVERSGLYSLSWSLFAYVGVIFLAGVAYALVKKVQKKEVLREARVRMIAYEKYAPLLKQIRAAEAKIAATYEKFLHPTLVLLKEEFPSQHLLSLHFDTVHWKLSQYKVDQPDPRAPRHVMSSEFYEMPVFEAMGKLADGAVMQLQVLRIVRVRNIRKVNPRGKIKYKTKTKYKLLYKVQLGLPTQAYQLVSHSIEAPAENIKVKFASSEKRHTFKVQQVEVRSSNNPLPQHKVFIELLGLVYRQVKSV
ncbi:hypothetical protein [Microscilla marina]|uniref:Uncharacterized protein n=1 Tax=Microscilla marina ATCC 23134 TaxID=313606 RepID=A1ZU20_MICM2|nr:hypothetical protein [Microscilla marina]EAY26133.1 hypothetical protein M23134_06006 [Microscilla marina ATCC 23134]